MTENNFQKTLTSAVPDDYVVPARRRWAANIGISASPSLPAAALHGLAGRFVTATAPGTEASPAALLITFLVCFAAMVGRAPYVMVGPAVHHARLFGLIVGDTSRARKGTSKAVVDQILKQMPLSGPFLDHHVIRGVQSGEALIDNIAVAIDNRNGVSVGELVVDEEYAGRTLIAAKRQNSILSGVLREAWDGDDLEAKSRANPVVAVAPHLNVLGHATMQELRHNLASTDIANGYANRFLHVFADRGQVLPEPTALPTDVARRFALQMDAAVTFARSTGEVTRSAAFREAWAELYYTLELAPSVDSVYDMMIARGAPQVLRLALVYALLDGSAMLKVEHLKAADALWSYCEQTVAYVFGHSFGQPRLDRVWSKLQEAGERGISRKELHLLLTNNATEQDINEILAHFTGTGLAVVQRFPTGGRPREALVAVA
jgi:hypothetical protein